MAMQPAVNQKLPDDGYASVENVNATGTAPDPAAPTTMVHQFLAQRGLQPTSENVRRVLEENARNPGYIAGLVNNEPPTMPNAGGGNGALQTSPGASPQAGNQSIPLPPPPAPPMNGIPQSTDPSADSGIGMGGPIAALAAVGIPIIAKMVMNYMRAPGASPGMQTQSMPGAMPGQGAQQVGGVERMPQGDPTMSPAPAQIEAPRTAIDGPAQRPAGVGGINWEQPGMVPSPVAATALPAPSPVQAGAEPIAMPAPRPTPGEPIPLPAPSRKVQLPPRLRNIPRP